MTTIAAYISAFSNGFVSKTRPICSRVGKIDGFISKTAAICSRNRTNGGTKDRWRRPKRKTKRRTKRKAGDFAGLVM